MIDSINAINAHSKGSWKPDVIISGGVRGPLDAYYLKSKLQANSLIGQAASVLKHARISEESLEKYVQSFLETYSMAKSFLKVRVNVDIIDGFSKLSKQQKINWLASLYEDQTAEDIKHMSQFWHPDNEFKNYLTSLVRILS